jgi:hypothetical protein
MGKEDRTNLTNTNLPVGFSQMEPHILNFSCIFCSIVFQASPRSDFKQIDIPKYLKISNQLRTKIEICQKYPSDY